MQGFLLYTQIFSFTHKYCGAFPIEAIEKPATSLIGKLSMAGLNGPLRARVYKQRTGNSFEIAQLERMCAMKITRWLIVLSVLSVAAVPAWSDLIPGLFNTGVISQTPPVLNSVGSVDPHYSLILSADAAFPGPATYVVTPVCCWVGADGSSQWIAPRPDTWTTDATVSHTEGQYDYRLTFDLTGDPNTASITGQWATDNNGGAILLNGVSTGLTTGFTDFSFWTPFTINSGFVAGLNTLDFPVFNGCCPARNPTGLRVEFLSSTVAPPVPEPSSLILIGTVVLLVGMKFRPVGRYKHS